MAQEPELVSVRTVQGWDVAQIYKSKLEAAEIPVLLKYQSLGQILGVTIDGLGAVQLLVPREFADEAEALLENVEEALEEDWEEAEETGKEEEEEEEEDGV